jgi:hypothetical protein
MSKGIVEGIFTEKKSRYARGSGTIPFGHDARTVFCPRGYTLD